MHQSHWWVAVGLALASGVAVEYARAQAQAARPPKTPERAPATAEAPAPSGQAPPAEPVAPGAPEAQDETEAGVEVGAAPPSSAEGQPDDAAVEAPAPSTAKKPKAAEPKSAVQHAPSAASRSTAKGKATPARPPVAQSIPIKLNGSSIIVGIDRLAGVYAWSATVSTRSMGTTFRSELGGTMVNAAFVNTGTNSDEGALNPFAGARLGADAVFIGGVTLGAILGYATASGAREDFTNDTSSGTDPFADAAILVAGARAGYILVLSDALSVWLRLGVTLARISDDDVLTDQVTTYVDLTLDPALVLTPFPHFGVTVGPALDFGLGGGGEVVGDGTVTDLDGTFTNLGLAAGALVYW